MEKNPSGLRKGAWTEEEDNLLRTCIHKYGEGKWNLVPQRAGLKRCRKTCRMRWLNYLKPNINRGSFTEDEVDMIRRFHKLLGNRWSMIAGRLPGRTANDVKNYWHTNMRKKKAENHHREKAKEENPEEETAEVKRHVVIRPQPHSFFKNSVWLRGNYKLVSAASESGDGSPATSTTASFAQPCPPADLNIESEEWWESLLNKEGDEGQKGSSDLMELLDPDFLKMEGLFGESQTFWSQYSRNFNHWDSPTSGI